MCVKLAIVLISVFIVLDILSYSAGTTFEPSIVGVIAHSLFRVKANILGYIGTICQIYCYLVRKPPIAHLPL